MAAIRVFISSVQAEFSKERRLLYDYIKQDALLGEFFVPFIFEKLPAADISAQEAYLKEAGECDIYLGLLGEQYGNEDTQGVSPTEREYDEATKHFAHRLIYIKRIKTSRHSKEQLFIDRVQTEVVRKSFDDSEELKTAVYASLVRYLESKEILRKLPFDASALQSADWGDIDPDKVRSFVEKAKEKRHSKLSFSDGLEKIFTSIHILTDDGRLTNSAVLLFGRDPQRFFRTSEVRCAQFYGTKVEKPVRNYQVYQGTLFELIDAAVGFVMSRIDCEVGTRESSTDAPVKYELPESAVAEAIANAVAHRDYTSNGSIQVMLFRDRLEVWNPGRLPFGLTTAKLREIHPSTPVNPVIAHPLFLTGNIEHLGTGTTDMIDDCEAYGLKAPEFIQDDEFRVIIWRKESNNAKAESNNAEAESNNAKAESNNAREKSNNDTVRLTKKQKMVIDFCRDTPRTREEILGYVNVKLQTKTFKQYITKLIDQGLLRPLEGKSKSPSQRYITTAE